MSQEIPGRSSVNPYAAPRAESEAVVPPPSEPTAGEVFLAWEYLRIYYNAILAMEWIVLAFVTHATLREFAANAFFGGLIANVCFCLGPVLEGYAALCGANRTLGRWLLFIAGTLLALSLPLVAIVFAMQALEGAGPG